jgi:hypothetical protein
MRIIERKESTILFENENVLNVLKSKFNGKSAKKVTKKKFNTLMARALPIVGIYEPVPLAWWK